MLFIYKIHVNVMQCVMLFSMVDCLHYLRLFEINNYNLIHFVLFKHYRIYHHQPRFTITRTSRIKSSNIFDIKADNNISTLKFLSADIKKKLIINNLILFED